jgi:hypothetical protein
MGSVARGRRIVQAIVGVPAMAGGSVLLLVLLAGVVRSTRHSTSFRLHAPDLGARQREAASRAALEHAHQHALAAGKSEEEWLAGLAAERREFEARRAALEAVKRERERAAHREPASIRE